MQNSHLMSQLAQQHIADLRRDAAARVRGDERHRSGSAHVVTPGHRPSPARRRAGWWLVTFGLRLAVGRPASALQ